MSFLEKTADNFPLFNGKYVGIDRGIKQLAVTSDKRFFGGGQFKKFLVGINA
jgi:transposase